MDLDWVELILDIAEDVVPDIIEAIAKKRERYKKSDKYKEDIRDKRDRKIKKESYKELRKKRRQERKERIEEIKRLRKQGHTGKMVDDGFK